MLFPYWHKCVHLVKTWQMESLRWHCQMKQSENDLEIKKYNNEHNFVNKN